MVKHLLTKHPNLFELSISCTTRPPRGQEVHGKEYYFISVEEFQKRIEHNDFIEFEQVYEGLYYGTLKEEIDRIEAAGRQVLFDVDVKGGSWVTRLRLSLSVRPPLRNCVNGSKDAEILLPR